MLCGEKRTRMYTVKTVDALAKQCYLKGGRYSLQPSVILGRYIQRDSFIHKLDPRMKIFLAALLMIEGIMAWSYTSVAIVLLVSIALIIFSSISLGLYVKSTKFIVTLTIFSACLNLFYGTGEPIFKFWFLSITQEGIQNSLLVMARILNLTIVSACLTFTTSPNDMTYGIEWFLKPLQKFKIETQDMTMMLTIAIRFIPSVFEEANKIISAQKSRGADMHQKDLIKRLKSFIPVVVPLMMSSLRRAYELSTAMECRCYGICEKRTRMKKLCIDIGDIVALIFVLVTLAGVIVCNMNLVPCTI